MFTEWGNIFSEWVVEVVQRVFPRFQPARARFLYPARFFADFLFTVSIFFFLNRRVMSTYPGSFWSQLLYLLQFIKVIYTLRFLLVELAFREVRTFLCFLQPVLSRMAIIREWQKADPCVLKVVNLAFMFVFIGLNMLMAYFIEKLGWVLWKHFKRTREGQRLLYQLPKPLLMVFPERKQRCKRQRKKYQSGTRSRHTPAKNRGPLLWPLSWLTRFVRPKNSSNTEDAYDLDSDSTTDFIADSDTDWAPEGSTVSATDSVSDIVVDTSRDRASVDFFNSATDNGPDYFVNPATNRASGVIAQSDTDDDATDFASSTDMSSASDIVIRDAIDAISETSTEWTFISTTDSSTSYARSMRNFYNVDPSSDPGTDYWHRTRSGREY